MKRLISCLILVLSMAGGPSNAEQTVQQDNDELLALRHYSDVILSLESLKYITNAARGDWRPSNMLEDSTGLDGSGRLLRDLGKSLKSVADASELANQPWVARWENYNNASGLVRKVAAAINLSAEFVDAVQNAETSSAEEKLKAMAQLLDDINTLLPSTTGIGAYVGLMADMINEIAVDAAIIEAATKRTNDTIELVGKMIVGEDLPQPETNESDDLFGEMQARIQELENRAARREFSAAVAKIDAAESICSNMLNRPLDGISNQRAELALLNRRVQHIETAIVANQQVIPLLRLDIGSAQRAIIQAMEDALDATKVLAANARRQRLEAEIDALRDSLPATEIAVRERKSALEAELEASRAGRDAVAESLSIFDGCVQRHLSEPDFELENVVKTFYQQYQAADAENAEPDSVAWVDWQPGPANSQQSTLGKINLASGQTVTVTYQGSPAFIQTDGGTNYWNPATPYLSSIISNAPPNADIIALEGGNGVANRIHFDRPLKNPVMAIVSMGQGRAPVTYHFDQPFRILSNADGYWGSGRFEITGGTSLKGFEAHGAIQFMGEISSLNWTVPDPEYWHGFTIGLPQ